MTNLKTFKEELKIPNPEVYRSAAEYVLKGEEWYSCLAISSAVDSLYKGAGLTDLQVDKLTDRYIRQYSRVMGPAPRRAKLEHPFWNLTMSLRHPLREYRANALLFMAAICENPA